MELLGLFGRDIGYSCSPALHNAALRASGREGQYMLWPVSSDDFPIAMRGAFALGARGANVTTPHKIMAAGLAQRLDPLARRIGAANVLVRGHDGWIGHNTDVDGFWQPLAALGRSVRSALVLGTGGAALAVCAALEREGVALSVSGRDREKLGSLTRTFAAQPVDWAHRGEATGVDVIVNATTVGQKSLASPLAEDEIPRGAVVYDLIYSPSPTELLRRAQRRGCRTLGGGGMLLSQALLSWRLWFGEEPPHLAMADALQAAMRAVAGTGRGAQD